MEQLKNNLLSNLTSIASLIGVVGAIAAGFTTYGKFENRLEQLESREYVIVQETDLDPVYDKIETAKDLFREKLGESNRVWNTDSARIAENISTNKTNLEVLKKQVELLELKIEEIELENSNPLAR
jgi:hypothetical protein